MFSDPRRLKAHVEDTSNTELISYCSKNLGVLRGGHINSTRQKGVPEKPMRGTTAEEITG